MEQTPVVKVRWGDQLPNADEIVMQEIDTALMLLNSIKELSDRANCTKKEAAWALHFALYARDHRDTSGFPTYPT